MSKSASLALSALGALVAALLIVPFEVSAAEPSQAAETGAANGQAAEERRTQSRFARPALPAAIRS